MKTLDFETTLEALVLINDELKKIDHKNPEWQELKILAWDFCRQSTFLHVLCGERGEPTEISSSTKELYRFTQFASDFLEEESHATLLNETKEKLADCEAENFRNGLPSFSNDREEATFKLLKASSNCTSRIASLLSIENYLDTNRSFTLTSASEH